MSESKTLELQIKITAGQALAQVNALSGEIKSLAAQAKSFGGDSKKLEQAFKAHQAEAARAANSMKLFGITAAEAKRQQELAKAAALDLAEAGLKPESKEVQNLVAQYKQLEDQSKALDKANGDNINSFGGLKTAITQTAAAVALIKTVDKMKDLTGFALAQAGAFQTARNEFGILLGDMDAGAALFDRIKTFNDKTPFDLGTVKQAASVLLSADVPLARLNDRLTQFGDLSQGNSQKFGSYVDAFSKAAAKGKADMQVLNAYLNQGVPILKALAAGFNTTESAVMEMASQGKVGFADFSAALDRLAAEGGKYFGGMELGSKSLAAMQEGLRESVNALAASYGDILLPAAGAALALFADMANALNDNALLKGILAGAVAALTGYLAVLAARQAVVAVRTWAAYAAQMGFNSALAVTNPLLLAGIAAAAAATVAIVAYASAQQKANQQASAAALAAREQADAYKGAEAAARQYAQALDGMGVPAQRGVRRDLEQKISQAYQELARQQRLLANTPQRVPEKIEIKPGSGQYMTLDPVDNPEYARIQQSVKGLNAEIFQLQKNLDAVDKKMGEIERSSLSAFGSEWGDKLLSGVEAIEREKDRAVGELKAKAFSAFKEGFEKNKAYRAELAALEEYYQRKKADAERKDSESLGSAWRDRALDGIAAIKREQEKAQEELQAKAKKILGDNYREQAEYIAELDALDAWYGKRRQDAEDAARKAAQKADEDSKRREREAAMNAHSLRMQHYREEWEYRLAMARNEVERGNYKAGGRFMAAQFMYQSAGSQFGELASAFKGSGGASAGGVVWMQLVKAVADAAMELENFQKTLNWADTAVKKAFETVGPMVNEALAVLSDPLEDIGRIAGQLLAPLSGILQTAASVGRIINTGLMLPLTLLGSGFEWLYNFCIYPVGNALIRIVNGVIDALNAIPMVNIKKINYLNVIGDTAVEMAKEMERRKEEISKMYERQKDLVRDELAAQISSIRQQYELGLISRGDYEKQAEQYRNTADIQLYEINERMLGELERISENTNAALTPVQQKMAGTADKAGSAVQDFFTSSTGQGVAQTAAALTVPVVTGTASAIAEASRGNWGTAVGNILTGGLWGAAKKLFKFDVGTPYVPHDMAAVIHQGEGVIPRTFNEGIRAGDYALVGRSRPGGGGEAPRTGTAINVNITVEGSVIREKGLAEAVYEGIAAGIKAGELDPLPA